MVQFKDLQMYSWFFLPNDKDIPRNFAKYKNGDNSFLGSHILWERYIDADAIVIPARWDADKRDYVPAQ